MNNPNKNNNNIGESAIKTTSVNIPTLDGTEAMDVTIAVNPDLPCQAVTYAPVMSVAPQALENIPTLDGSKQDGPQVDPDFEEDLAALRAEESNSNPLPEGSVTTNMESETKVVETQSEGNFANWDLVDGRLRRRAIGYQRKHGGTAKEAIEFAQSRVKARENQSSQPSSSHVKTLNKSANKKSKRTPAPVIEEPKPLTAMQALSYSAAVSGIPVAFVSTDPEKQNLNLEETERLRDAIIDAPPRFKDEELRPRFHGFQCQSGFVTGVAANEMSIKWIQRHCQKIGEELKLPFRVALGDDIPHRHVIKGFFVRAMEFTDELILEFIHYQNFGLDSLKWKILKREPFGSDAVVVFGIHEEAHKTLESTNFINGYRAGHVQVESFTKKKEEDARRRALVSQPGTSVAQPFIPPNPREHRKKKAPYKLKYKGKSPSQCHALPDPGRNDKARRPKTSEAYPPLNPGGNTSPS